MSEEEKELKAIKRKAKYLPNGGMDELSASLFSKSIKDHSDTFVYSLS